MDTKVAYNDENQIWTERLTALANCLTDDDLDQPMEADWTVSAVLAHLAFWDIRLVTLLEKWRMEGRVSESPIDSHLINEVTRRLFISIPGRTAADLAVVWARKADQAIAALSPEIVAEIGEKAPNVRVDRLHHRKIHIEEIEKVLHIDPID